MYSLTSEETLHLAVIMDGNGRWATARGLERLKGHAKGVERVREVVEKCPELGVSHLTLFAFSTENWKRSEREVSGLMALFRRYIRSEAARLFDEGVRVRFIGRREDLDRRLRDLMTGLEVQTQDCTKLNLTIAINYGGRDEIARAVRKIVADAKIGEVQPEDVSDDLIRSYLDTPHLPDVDLLLRTSGEFRTSNFLPWQSVYAEMVFEQTAWPDFTGETFVQTLEAFKSRDRRFGAVKAK